MDRELAEYKAKYIDHKSKYTPEKPKGVTEESVAFYCLVIKHIADEIWRRGQHSHTTQSEKPNELAS